MNLPNKETLFFLNKADIDNEGDNDIVNEIYAMYLHFRRGYL